MEGRMKNINQLSEDGGCVRNALSALLLVTLFLLLPGFSQSQTKKADGISSLTPWIGVWTFNDDASSTVINDPSQKTTVEIKPMSDGKGLEITRKVVSQPDVKEWLVPDGSKRSVNASNCTGWQTDKMMPEAGIIFSSSEMSCKDAGAFSTSNVKMIVAADRMVDILSLKSGGQTRLATRRLVLERDWATAGSSEPAYANTVERMAASSPWNKDMVVQLSKQIEIHLFEAALIEKKVKLELNAGVLKDLKKANISGELIDLLVALAYPDKFHIEKNGKVELKPWIVSSPSGSVRNSYSSSSAALPGGTNYYQGLLYNCGFVDAQYNPYGYGGLFSPGSCWSIYSPFWYDYRIYIPVSRNYSDSPGGGGSAGVPGPRVPSSDARLDAAGGYIQIEPQTSNHHAKPREGSSNSSGGGRSNVFYSSGSAVNAASGGGNSAPASSSSAAPAVNSPSPIPSSGSSSGASVSPAGGYSSGGASTGHTAVPR
jgi:hypothetical protein